MLKNCPFCGGAAHACKRIAPSAYFVACHTCFINTDYHKTPEEAEAAWNRRDDGWIKVSERLPEIPEKQAYIECQVTILQSGKKKTVAMYYEKNIRRGKEVFQWKWQGRLSPWEPIDWKYLSHPPKEVL